MCTLSPSASRESAQHMLARLVSSLLSTDFIFPSAALYKDTNIITLLCFRVRSQLKRDGKSAEGQLTLQPLL